MRAQQKKKENLVDLTPSTPRPTGKDGREVIGFLILTASVILFLSLLLNPSAVRGISTSSDRNSAGIVGHQIALLFGTLFGLSAYLVPVLSGLWGLRLFWRGAIPRVNIFASTVGLALAIVTISALFGRVFGEAYLGGALGDRLAADLDRSFGVVTYVVLVFLGMTALVVSTPFTYRGLFESAAMGIGSLIAVGASGWRAVEDLATRKEDGAEAETTESVPAEEDEEEEPDPVVNAEAPPTRREIFEKTKARVIPLLSKRGPAMKPANVPPPPPSPAQAPPPAPGSAGPMKDPAAFTLPDTSLLDPVIVETVIEEEDLKRKAQVLADTLAEFAVDCKVGDIIPGPVVTRFELIPAPGVKVSQIVNLQDDIALSMAAPQIRIEAPIPGKSAVGIEVPNRRSSLVGLREVLESDSFRDARAKSPLAIALGKDISGIPVVADLRKMPHLLIAGATGAGKSVTINALIQSILYSAKADEVKFLMIDPKVVELQDYNLIPHLLAPVVTDVRLAPRVLEWAVGEMDRRYQWLAKAGVRDIESYNLGAGEKSRARAAAEGAEARGGRPDGRPDGRSEELPPDRLPYIVLVVDEFADLMLLAAKECEEAIIRLAQMARAIGIHLVIATQRPSVDVITGVIKANLPSRIAFQVTSRVDSRTILDIQGAERLLGRGDMLFKPGDRPKPIRIQGAFISNEEIHRAIDHYADQGRAPYALQISAQPLPGQPSNQLSEAEDELIPQALRIAAEDGMASVSRLQRRLQIGHPRASRLVDILEARGYVGPPDGSKPRELRFDPAQVSEIIERLPR